MPNPVKFLKSAEREYFGLPLPIQNDVDEKVKILKEFSYAGKTMEKAYQGYRSILAWRGQYRIIYRILEDQTVEIAYIRHCRRQVGLRLIGKILKETDED